MANGINKVILIGNLGQDPDVRRTPSGMAITNVNVATTDSWQDKNSGEKKELTEWHRVIFFRKLAEIAEEYLRKGAKVYVEGTLRTRKWQDKNGAERQTTEIHANNMQMLDKRAPNEPAVKWPSDDGNNAGGSSYLDDGGVLPNFDDSIPF